MEDLALLVGNTDAALLSEGAATSVVAGNTDIGRAGGFSQNTCLPALRQAIADAA